jgi:menaquinone-specific isochorismate synthase
MLISGGSQRRVVAENVDSAPASRQTLLSRSCEISDVSFAAFLNSQPTPRVHWAAPSGLELAGGGAAATLEARDGYRFDRLTAGADEIFDSVDHRGPREARPRLLGGLAFSATTEPGSPWEGFPSALFLVPRIEVTRTSDATWLTVRSSDPETTRAELEAELEAAREEIAELPMMRSRGTTPTVRSKRVITPKAEWLDQVRRTTERIREGALTKVVLATALDVELSDRVDVATILERLRRTYNNCYRFLVQPTAEAAFFGPPPERLVKRTGRTVRTEALAGSVPRGGTLDEDDELAASLRSSEKYREEQRLVVDTIREQLASLGEVAVGERGIRRLTNIQHLQTDITATLSEDTHVLDIVSALHPTPAVGGIPQAEARDHIERTESFDRGWYAAPVGWFDADGEGEFAVAIRSGVASGSRVTLFAGNGIVADSDPAAEWEEIHPKFRPILDEFGDD